MVPGGRLGRETRLTVRMVFFPRFHEAEIEQHFLVSLFILEEEAIDGHV